MRNHAKRLNLFGVLKNLRNADIGVGPRVILSEALAILLAGLVLAGAWLIVAVNSSLGTFYDLEYAILYNEDVQLLFGIAAFLWLIGLIPIWRGSGLRGVPLRILSLTIAVLVLTVLVCLGVVDHLGMVESSPLVAAIALVGAAIALCVWLPLMVDSRLGRPVVDEHDNVRVFCPKCGYSLIGLRECRCPECGHSFTLDEIIRKQDFATLARPIPSPERPSDAS